MSKIRVHVLAKELKISAAALKKTLADLGVVVKSHMSFLEDDVADKIRQMFNAQLSANRHPEVIENKKSSSEADRKVVVKNDDTPKKSRDNSRSDYKHERLNTSNNRRTNSSSEKKYTERKSHDRKPQHNDAKAPEKKTALPINSADKIKALLKKKSQAATTDSYYHADNVAEREQNKKNRQSQTRNRPQGDRRDNNNRRGSFNNNRKDGKPAFQKRPQDGAPRPDRSKTSPRFNPANNTAKVQPVDALAKTDISKKFGKNKKSSKDFGESSKHIKNKLKSSKKKSKYVDYSKELDEATISKNIKKTLRKTKKNKKYHKEAQSSSQQVVDGVIKISEFTSVSELARIIGVPATDIIGKFFAAGQMVTINQRLDKDSLELMCAEYDLEYQFEDEVGTDVLKKDTDEYDDVELVERSPIVTIMGHVDHGKTSILDYIRNENVVAGESGGITQHIGAYQITYNDRRITFLDTPGHEAFSAMRSRGANVTDIAVIVVAANDGVMPQTIEAIDHAKAAGVTIVVAINKCDLPEANVDKTIAELLEKGVYLEGYGGEILWGQCSAKTGEGVNELLDLMLLSAEMDEYSARYEVPGEGIVIESQKDARMGSIITVLLREGRLKKGDNIVCGATYGKVRKLENERGTEINELGPSDVARLFGLNDVPKAGDVLNVVESDKIAKSISSERQLIRRERENFQNKASLNNIFDRIKENQLTDLNLIVKADTDGSVEALCDSFEKLSNDEVKVQIIRKSVGGINEADISLASASDAVIIGFHVRSSAKAQKLADLEGVEVKLYHIIYDAILDVKSAIEGMLSPTLVEKAIGSARVKEVFKIKKVGNIAGCAVESGYILNDAKARIYRNDVMLYEGNLSSLKHFANDAKEVKAGTECGIGFENYNDLKEGDVIESYIIVEEKKTL